MASSRWALWGPDFPGPTDEGVWRIETLRACLDVCSFLLEAAPAPAVLEFARRVLRVDTLQALAGRLADVRQALGAAVDDAAPGAVPGASEHKPLELLWYLMLMRTTTALLGSCLRLAGADEGAAAVVPSSSAAAAAEAEQAAAEDCYRLELAAALRSSYIAEHIAATVTVLLQIFSISRELPVLPERRALFHGEATVVDLLLREISRTTNQHLGIALDLPGPAAASLQGCASGQQHSLPLASLAGAAALGPCASYITLAYGMSVLSYMDGGDTRGLPEDVRRALGETLRSDTRALLQQTASEQESAISALRDLSVARPVRNLMNALSAAAHAAGVAHPAAPSSGGAQPPPDHHPASSASSAAPTPATAAGLNPAVMGATQPGRLQLGWHTAIALAMRAARLGVRAAAEARAGRTPEQEAAALTAALEGTGPFRMLMSEACAALVAMEGLLAASRLRLMLAYRHGGEEDPGAEWWRLMAWMAPRLSLLSKASESSAWAVTFGERLMMHLPQASTLPEPLPPVPPPAVASALAGGVLPCLEGLIRRATAAPPAGDEGLAAEPGPDVQALMPLEAAFQADELQGRGCWDWLAVLLAYGNPREAGALITTVGKALSRLGHSHDPLTVFVGGICYRLLVRGRGWLDIAAARLERGEALTSPERQLAGLLGAAAAAWLPVMSGRTWTGYIEHLIPLDCVTVVLCWLPLLSCAASPTDRSAAAAAVGQELSVVEAQASGSGGWVRYAVGLFRPESFLGMALEVWSDPSTDKAWRDAVALWLAEVAGTVAALYPEAGPANLGGALKVGHLRALASGLKARRHGEEAEAVFALAALAARWERGGGARGGSRSGGRAAAANGTQASAARCGAWVPRLEAAAAILPASPAAARQLLGGCSNPACKNVEGDSDATLPLRACAGCGGAASYCSRECQTAHWRAGHRQECRGGAGGGGRG